MTAITAKQRAALKRALNIRRRQIELALRGDTERLQAEAEDASAGVPDRAEQATHDVSVDLAVAAVRRDGDELDAIDAALQRIDQLDYGSCLDCGRPIAYERLKLFPEASRCVSCQAQSEKGTGLNTRSL
jgi:RNA polymerase-binding protein DksA